MSHPASNMQSPIDWKLFRANLPCWIRYKQLLLFYKFLFYIIDKRINSKFKMKTNAYLIEMIESKRRAIGSTIGKPSIKRNKIRKINENVSRKTTS